MGEVSRRRLVALIVLAVLPYLGALGGGLVYDDPWLIDRDPRVLNGEVVAAVSGPYWPDRAGGLYRPVTTLSLVANGRLSLRPWAFRAVNVLLHAGAALVAWGLARRMTGDGTTAWLAAALFAVHPIHVEAVAQVGGRGEALAFVAGGLAWLLARDGRIVAAAALALASLLSKESGLGLALGAAVHAALDPPGGKRAGAIARAAAPWAIALVPALIARRAALGERVIPTLSNRIPTFMNPLVTEPLAVRLANAPVLLAFYLRKLAWPFGALAWDYVGSIDLAIGDARPAFFAALLLAAAALTARAGRARSAAVGLALFAAMLAPFLQLVPIGTLAGDRLAFAASLGFAVAAADLVAKLRGRLRPVAFRLVVAVALAALAGETARLAPVWGDETLFHELGEARAPLSAQARWNAGAWHANRQEWAKATADLGQASALAKDEPAILEAYGEALIGATRDPEAESVLRRLLALGTRGPKLDAHARYLLAVALREQGREQEARDELEKSVALSPAPSACANLGLLLRERDPRRARALLEQSLSLDPEQPKAKELRSEIEKLPR